MDDPFHTLGLPRRFDLTPADISAAHRRSVARFHPDRATDAFERDRLVRLSSEAGEAKQRLLTDLGRAEELLRALHGQGGSAGPGPSAQPSPAFLMETIELREEIDAVLASRDPAARASLEARVGGLRADCVAGLASAFAAQPPDLVAAAEGLVRLRYVDRMVLRLQDGAA